MALESSSSCNHESIYFTRRCKSSPLYDSSVLRNLGGWLAAWPTLPLRRKNWSLKVGPNIVQYFSSWSSDYPPSITITMIHQSHRSQTWIAIPIYLTSKWTCLLSNPSMLLAGWASPLQLWHQIAHRRGIRYVERTRHRGRGLTLHTWILGKVVEAWFMAVQFMACLYHLHILTPPPPCHAKQTLRYPTRIPEDYMSRHLQISRSKWRNLTMYPVL